MRDIVRAVSLVSFVVMAVFCFGVMQGCNTVEGAGEDIEAAGQGIENAAD